jgi:hypothetical protein
VTEFRQRPRSRITLAAAAGRTRPTAAALPPAPPDDLAVVRAAERRLWSLVDRLIASPRTLDREVLDELGDFLCREVPQALDAYDAVMADGLRQLLAAPLPSAQK